MSLTSYRAAPPRGDRTNCEESDLVGFSGLAVTYSPASWDAVPSARRRLTAEFGMGSGVSLALLPPNLESPPGRGGRLRGARPRGTRDRLSRHSGRRPPRGRASRLPDRIEACRAISTGQLNALPRLYLRPIDVVVFHGPQGRPGFEGGFPLRCLQRLSCPHIATLHCRWHDNRSTSGAFTPVLSY
jgi:hypothetical protein